MYCVDPVKNRRNRLAAAALLVVLILLPAWALADFSASGTVYDPSLSQDALSISEMCYTPVMQQLYLSARGYRRVGLYHQERSGEREHVVTYMVYDRTVPDGRSEVIIAIRGTGEGEWELNLDLMPSGDFDLPYAENFFLAAEDILSAQESYFETLSSPAFLVCGHSRGAAVANVLGAALTDRFGQENVFVYTFATPATVRGDAKDYPNIFNVLNPADLIPYLPLPQWGVGRYGTDILLPIGDETLLEAAQAAYEKRIDKLSDFAMPDGRTDAAETLIGLLSALCPDVETTYTLRHALAHPGEAQENEAGITAGEFLFRLLSGGDTASLERAENDFTPMLSYIRAAGEELGGSWMWDMHMPGIYGAWMAAMDPEEPETP